MHKQIKNLVLAAMFLAIGQVLPFLTGQIPQIGSMLLPMHLPVFLCGLILGWQYGLFVGFVTPLMRSLLFGMPPMYPTAIAMSLELATYGFVAGFIYNRAKHQCIWMLFKSMIPAMILGRCIWAIAQVILLGIRGNAFTWTIFINGALLNAIPGIILQLIFIPALMLALHRTRLVPFRRMLPEQEENHHLQHE